MPTSVGHKSTTNKNRQTKLEEVDQQKISVSTTSKHPLGEIIKEEFFFHSHIDFLCHNFNLEVVVVVPLGSTTYPNFGKRI
jgi:hypothetical protein